MPHCGSTLFVLIMYIVQLYKEDWAILRMLGCRAVALPTTEQIAVFKQYIIGKLNSSSARYTFICKSITICTKALNIQTLKEVYVKIYLDFFLCPFSSFGVDEVAGSISHESSKLQGRNACAVYLHT